MKVRGLFKTIFGEKDLTKNQTKDATSFNMYSLLNTFNSIYTVNNGNAWDMDIVRSAVDAYCRNFAKLKAKHTKVGNTKSKIEKLLNYKPNPLMEAYSFYYKTAANLKLTNNAFIYPEYSDTGELIALWPLMSNQIELLEYQNQLYLKFVFRTGRIKVMPYEGIIHIRGQFFEHDIFGSKNYALRPALDTVIAINQGVSNSAKMINSIRGILSAKISSKADDLKKARDKFVDNNFKISSNGSGIIVTDAKMDYTPINEKTTPLQSDQLSYAKNAIYDYFGVNEQIVQNKFSEEEWNAFYEGAIEPVAIQMSQCFTNALFTENERNFGNEVTFEANRLQYASNTTKVSVVKELAPLAVLMIDDVREMFNLAPLPNDEGQKTLQSLNYINSNIADQYQSNNNQAQPINEEDNQSTITIDEGGGGEDGNQ